MTAVSTPSGKSTSSPSRLWRRDVAQAQPAGRRRAAARRRRRPGRNRWSPVRRRLDVREPGDRAAVEDPAAALAGGRARRRRPSRRGARRRGRARRRTASCRRPSRVEDVEQRLGVGGVQPGRGLVEHVDDAEQPGAQLRREPQPLRLAGGQGGRGPVQAEVAEPEVEQHGDPVDAGRGRAAPRPRCARRSSAPAWAAPGAGSSAVGRSAAASSSSGSAPASAMVAAGERHGQRLGPQPAAPARRAGGRGHEAQRPGPRCSLRVSARVCRHVPPGAPELPVVLASPAPSRW